MNFQNQLKITALSLRPFGPTGIVNENQLSSVGQGLKKLFRTQREYPRVFSTDEISSGLQKRGSSSGVFSVTYPVVPPPPPPPPPPPIVCCPYSADDIGQATLYLEEDLPDFVIIDPSGVDMGISGPTQANRVGFDFITENENVILAIDQNQWTIKFDSGGGMQFYPSIYSNSCLINYYSGSGTVDGVKISDGFSQSYSIYINFLVLSSEQNLVVDQLFTVDRTGICTWEQTVEINDPNALNVKLIIPQEPSRKWKIVVDGLAEPIKRNLQNDPIGNYGVEISGQYEATVSPA